MYRFRYGLVVAIALATFPLYSHAQNWSARNVPSDWLTNAIPSDQRTHDFGTVARAAKTEHRFYIKNTTEGDIHLRSVRASCGCTTPIIETNVVKPGETGSILARFNTGTFTGQKQATLTVSIDQPYRTELQLLVRGYIRSDIVVNPGSIAFGDIPSGEAKSIEFTIDYAGRGDWAIEGIQNDLGFMNADFEEISRGSGRVKYKVTASIDASAPVGLINNQLIVQTNDRRLTSVPVTLSANIQPAIQISPNSFQLGQMEPGKQVSQRIVLKGKEPFRILDITSDQAEIEFDPSEEAKAAHLINVVIRPKRGIGGTIDGTLRFKTDLEESLEMGLTYTVAQTQPVDTVPNETPADVN